MLAMVLERPGEPLKLVERPDPQPSDGEVRVQVAACGVCRTDLHVVDGELPNLPCHRDAVELIPACLRRICGGKQYGWGALITGNRLLEQTY
jgi:threonine dehydrogenase-like Zn-dependent dehydrogenase